MGEVRVAKAIANALCEQGYKRKLTVTSSTPHGLQKARQELGLSAQVVPFPMDFIWAAKGAAQRIRPKVYVSLETEIWPNLLLSLYKQKTNILMLNGRISARSFPRYQKIRPLIDACLRFFTCFSMISEMDAERIIALGADPKKVRVDGNAKYTYLHQHALTTDPVLEKRLNLNGRPLLVAGSVRGGEEEAVLRAFASARGHGAVLLIAPRHVRKAGKWLALARHKGFTPAYFSELDKRLPEVDVVVLDEMGQLLDFYGLARAAFVGASLVGKGGQNPLEPAAWGVPVAFGPHMEDFSDASKVLLPEAALQVADGEQLGAFWRQCLTNEDYAQHMGRRGQAKVAGLARSADSSARLILQYMEEAA